MPPEGTPPPDARALGVSERRAELRRLRQKVADLSQRYQAAKKREADTKQAIEAATLNLEIKTAERRMLELRKADVEKAALEAYNFRNDGKRRVDSLRTALSLRLNALYRMGRTGYLRALAAVDSGPAFLRGLQMLAFMAKRDSELVRQYEKALVELSQREASLRKEKQELTRVVLEAREKERELQEARTDLTAALRKVQQSAADTKTVLEKLEEKANRLDALLSLLESRGRALPPGAASIQKFKGVLDWPAKGRVAVPFGRIANPRFPQTFLRSSGWTIEIGRGTEARAIFAGDVVYSQWLKGYGNLVVLDHGDGVFSLYGRLMPGTAPKGMRVGVGDSVGRVGDPPEDEIPGLYFEIRESRTSVDPRHWLR